MRSVQPVVAEVGLVRVRGTVRVRIRVRVRARVRGRGRGRVPMKTCRVFAVRSMVPASCRTDLGQVAVNMTVCLPAASAGNASTMILSCGYELGLGLGLGLRLGERLGLGSGLGLGFRVRG